MVVDSEIREADTKELQSIVRSSLFVRSKGGFGHKGTIKNVYPAAPKRQPDFTGEESITKNQAFLYRLCNDRNPLHVDPDMAKMGGFEVPILHGLCTYGITARSVQQHFFKEDADRLKSMSARFVGHVFPGETLIVNAWQEKDTIVFQSKTKERGKPVLIGYLTLKEAGKL